VATALDLGASVDEAWSMADPQRQLAQIADGFQRSARSGAPLADVLTGIAGDLRRHHRQSVEVQARIAGVRAIAPLAVCFLPAFLLVGAVPIVASFATGLFAL
jgi:pilus assembly protein TadC